MKKIAIIIYIFIVSLFFTNDVFALKKPQFSNIVINTADNTISGVLNNAHNGGEIELVLYSLALGTYHNNDIPLGNDYIEWKKGPFSINFGSVLDLLTVDGNSFVDEGYNPPRVYDAILMDVGDDDSSIESQDHIGFRVVNTPSNNQNSSNQGNININIINESATLETKQSNGNNFYYYHITGGLDGLGAGRQLDFPGKTVYLVLKKENGPKKILCSYANSMGNRFEFPACTGRNEQTLIASDFLEPGNYTYYFTVGDINGSPVSKIVNITTPVPGQASQQQDVVTNLKITPKKNGNKNYYQISGYINETKPGKTLYFRVVKEGETGGEIIGEWDYKKGNFSIPSDNAERDRIGNLSPGKYVLKISETKTGGTPVQSDVSISKQISDSSSSNSSSSNSSSSGSLWSNKLEGGLVKTDCGYNLAPGKGGRMCVFSDLMSLIGRVIDYIFVLILPIAAIIFAYAGFLYITSGEKPEKRTAAKKAMTYLVVGIVVIMMAWLLVKTVLVSLGVKPGFTLYLDI